MKKVYFFLLAICLTGVFLLVSCDNIEQETRVSDVSFTPCQQDGIMRSNSPSNNAVSVEFINNGVQITHYDFEVRCDFTTVNVTHTFVNGVLNITQQGDGEARCICYTDVSYTINGISQNQVNVIFINGVQVYCHNGNNQTGIPFTVIAQGDLYGNGAEGFTKQFSVITTETDWENLKTQLNSVNNVTQHFTETNIDFSLYQVIFIIDKVKGNGGWSIDVTDVTEYTDKIVITVSNVRTGGMTCVMTQPFQIVKIPVSNKPIIFNDLTLLSNDNDQPEDTNFYNLEYRTGLWVSINKRDTLDFVNSTELIRKGFYYRYEEYLYRIEDNTLIISVPNNENIKTYHSIMRVENDTVVLGNMYISIGFYDNSGTFIKE